MYNVLVPNIGTVSNFSEWPKLFGPNFKFYFTADPDRYVDVDMVMFTGGSDVHPKLYGEGKHRTTHINEERDQCDIEFYQRAVANRWPMLGICRGGQFLNVMNGGRMVQNVHGHAIATSGRHKITIAKTGEQISVTSTHHQMMHPTAEAKILAYAKGLSSYYALPSDLDDKHFRMEFTGTDGVVNEPEVVFYDKTNALCVQFHPEYIQDPKDPCVTYFKGLVGRFIKGVTL